MDIEKIRVKLIENLLVFKVEVYHTSVYTKSSQVMEPSVVRFVLLIMYIYLRLTRAMDSQSYQANPEFDNKVYIKEPLYNKTTGSLLSCSVLCGDGCNCFNFNLLTGMCLLSASCNPLHECMTVSQNGWRFFFDPYVMPNEHEKTGFIVLFMPHSENTTKDIYFASKKGASINITTSSRLDHSLKQQIDKMIAINSSHHIIIPPAIELESFRREVKSIFIETSDDVFVVSHGYTHGTIGSTAIVPLHKLATNYIVISTEPTIRKSQFAVAAAEDNTVISITFKMKRSISLYIDENSFLNGDVYNFTLDRFETYQIAHVTDLTGTVIESSVPIAVFSGNDCNRLENIGACDHLIQQVIPTKELDKTYIVPPNSNDRRTIVRITATENSNISYTINRTTQIVTIKKMDSFDTIISSRQACVIESKTPIIVTSFGLQSSSSTMGDPSMTVVPGINQYIDYYKTVVRSGFNYSYVTVMIKQSFKDSIRINNTMTNGSNIVFEENVSVMNLTYNVRSIRVPEGELSVSTTCGEHFGLMFSGVNAYAAYAFSAILL